MHQQERVTHRFVAGANDPIQISPVDTYWRFFDEYFSFYPLYFYWSKVTPMSWELASRGTINDDECYTEKARMFLKFLWSGLGPIVREEN